MKTELDLASPRDQLREQLSALADGELSGASARPCWAALARDDDAVLVQWAHYHRIGDVLRGGSQLAGHGDELAFVAAFRERLAASTRSAADAKVVPFPAVAVPAAAQAEPAAAERHAANDGVYRWKMVAGLATVMAVLVVGWTALEEPPAGMGMPAVQEIAAQQPAADGNLATVAGNAPAGRAGQGPVRPASASAVALVPEAELRRVSQPGLVLERGTTGSAASRYALQAANDGVDSVMIRDPRLDEFLAAHRQGSASVLQTPVDFVRDVVVQPAP